MQTPGRFLQHLSQRLTLRLGTILSLVVISILSLLIAAIMKARNDAIARARLEASYVSAALNYDVEGVLNTIACVSKFVKAQIDSNIGPSFLSEVYEKIHPDVPALSSISIIGPEGSLIAKSDGRDWDISNFSDFEFFRDQRLGPASVFRIGKPLTIAGRVTVPATRRLETKEGAFGGLVMFSIDPAMGAATYQKVNLGQSGSIKVAGTDGTIYAGYSLPGGFDPALIGASLPEQALTHWQLKPSGSFIATDWREFIIGARLQAFRSSHLWGLARRKP
jgi:hypothetical protein